MLPSDILSTVRNSVFRKNHSDKGATINIIEASVLMENCEITKNSGGVQTSGISLNSA